jgi:DUF2075 family protein/predicted ATPase
MIVYSASKLKFQNDVMTNDIEGIVYEAYKKATGRNTGISEQTSWRNSLQYMDRILNDDEISEDSTVSIEYRIPQSAKRIDFILAGQDGAGRDSAVLVELKQWQSAELTGKDGIVRTRFKHGETDTPHPSYQAWSYKCLLQDYNQTVQDDDIQLYPCAYLHNYLQDDVITNKAYEPYLKEAPVFLKDDALKLRDFIKSHIKYGDKNNVMYRINNGKIKPSKNLADQLTSMINGNNEFVLIDDQKVAYETALELASASLGSKKNVLIIEGGPGTGKSVLAINLLVELTKRELVAQYVTRNSAPREVYKAKLTGSFTHSRIDNMFSSSGAFHSLPADTFDVLIVDEAHRLNEKSGLFSHLGENQVKEIITSSKLSIFFIDENQKVTLKDIGTKDEICFWSARENAHVMALVLDSQFRCNGSDGYLAWLDNTLQIRTTANETMPGIDYDFQIIDNPTELHETIKDKNKEKNKARLVAGYCWKWISKRHPDLKDIVIDNYSATWNLNDDGQGWIAKPNSVSEVGCIHTSQGLEVDYIGVIIGPDLIVRDGRVVTVPSARATTDKSVHGWKKLMKEDPKTTSARLDAIIKNTYRTLMTRGQKGCYIFSTDRETQEYFKKLVD